MERGELIAAQLAEGAAHAGDCALMEGDRPCSCGGSALTLESAQPEPPRPAAPRLEESVAESLAAASALSPEPYNREALVEAVGTAIGVYHSGDGEFVGLLAEEVAKEVDRRRAENEGTA